MNPFVLACLLSAAQATTHHRFVSLKCDLNPRDTIQTIGYMTSTEEGAKTGLVLKSSSSIPFEVLLFPANKTILLYSQEPNEDKKLIKTASHDLDGHNDFILDVIKGTDGYYFFFDDTFAGMVPTFQGPPPALLETTHDVNTTSLDVFSDCTERHSPTGDKDWPLFLYDEVMEELNSNKGCPCETHEIHHESVRMKCDLKHRDVLHTIGIFTNLKEGGKTGLVLKSSSNILLEVLLFPANKTVHIYSQKPDEEKQLLHTTYAAFDSFADNGFAITIVKGPDGLYVFVDHIYLKMILDFQGPPPYIAETTYDVDTIVLDVFSDCTVDHTPSRDKEYFLRLYNKLVKEQNASKRPPAQPGTHPEYVWMICDLKTRDVIVAAGLFTSPDEEGAKMGLVLKSSNSILFEVNLYASNNTIYLYSQKPNEEKKLITHVDCKTPMFKPPAFTIYVVKGSDGYFVFHENAYMGKVPDFPGPPPFVVETTYDVKTYNLEVLSDCTNGHTVWRDHEWARRLINEVKDDEKAGYC